MPDADGLRAPKTFDTSTPVATQGFFLKGAGSLDWGMKDRLSRIFSPANGRTLMLAFDHGYFQGPTTGLERLDLAIPPLIPYTDALMATRGALRSSIAPSSGKPVVLRCSGGQSILKELSNELVAVDVEDAVRINASAMAVQVYIGGVHEHESLRNLVATVDTGYRYGVPVMGVTGVGKDLVRDSRYLGLATRITAEMGAHFVKTYYCETGFEQVVAGCPVPIVVAGGKKLPEREALELAWNSVQGGAAGVDMGRNIFQSAYPVAIIQAVRAVVHGNESVAHAFDLYETLSHQKETA